VNASEKRAQGKKLESEDQMTTRLSIDKQAEISAPRHQDQAHRGDARWRRYAGPAVVVAAAAVAVAPQLIRGNSCGHDFDVHLVSWLDCLNAWRHGIVYPHWTPSPNYGAGEPRFVFYPPLTWMAGAALGAVFGWWFAPIVFTFLCLAGTGLAVRALALEAFDNAVATLAGCTAIFSGFALFTAYERAAFPEFMGGVWLPLVILFALRERGDSSSSLRSAFDGSTVPLALALGASWLSNAPLGVIASYLLAALALAAALLRRSWAPVLRAGVAATLGMATTAFYWLPAAFERSWVDIRQATEDPGYNFENSWLFARHSNPLLQVHDAVLQQASWISVSMIAVALAALAVCWQRGVLSRLKSPAWWIPLAAIPVVVLFLLFPVSRPVWRAVPEMKFLQYPWRWMEAVEAPMAIFFAAAIWPRGRRAQRASCAVCTAAFLGATAFAAVRFFQVCWPEDTVASVVSDYRVGTGFEGMYEYEPPAADATLIAMGLPDACLASDAQAELGKQDADTGNLVWAAGQGNCAATFAWQQHGDENPEHRELRAATPQGGYLVLRLLRFPAWRVRVNGQDVASLPYRGDGLMAVPVPRGPSVLNIDWTTTADVTVSRWISAMGLLGLVAVGLLERRLRRVPVS
jgi:6-pyruvoyl-tetrahydropterin synthase related domain